MYYNSKRVKLKGLIYMIIILLIAVFSTHYIYYKFKAERNIDYNSENLDVVFHEQTGAEVTLSRVTPVTDSVGLSSKAYTFTIKNNLTEKVNYKIKLINDLKKYATDECEEYQIPLEFIKVSIKEDKNDNNIYNLVDLEKDILYSSEIDALDEKNFSVRVWVAQGSSVPTGSILHYHGLIQVFEDDNLVMR